MGVAPIATAFVYFGWLRRDRVWILAVLMVKGGGKYCELGGEQESDATLDSSFFMLNWVSLQLRRFQF